MKVLILYVFMLFLAACGAQKLAVDYADTLLTHQISKRIPMDSKRKQELSKDVDKLLSELKPTAKELIPVIEQIEIDKNKVPLQYKKLENYYLKIANRFSLLIAKYMARLDVKQQKDFFENLEDENKKIAKKDKGEMLENLEDRIEHFIGPLSGPQKNILKDYGDYFYSRNSERLESRKKLHQNFKPVFASGVDKTKLETFHEMLVKYQQSSIAGNKNLEIIQKFVATLSPAQKEHFRKEIKILKELLSYYLTVEY